MSNSFLIQKDVPLAPLTTLGVGGAARYFAEARSIEDVIAGLEFARIRGLPLFVLGGGSNLLVSDRGFDGLVLRIALLGTAWNADGRVVVAAGEPWDAFVGQCVARGLAGVECLSGIPGLVGATPIQNVGAYGQEVSETVVSVQVLDRRDHGVRELSPAECGFAYRRSIFNSSARECYIVLAVQFALRPGGAPALRYPDLRAVFADRADPPNLQEVRDAVRRIRAGKGMVTDPADPDSRSAGSFFKNPEVSEEDFARHLAPAQAPSFPAANGRRKVPAAWLIEHAGFRKGESRGGAGISSKHPLALINRDHATASEMLALAQEIQDRVQARFGVRLEPEPIFLGLI